jgi:hypothetical protein
MNASARPLDVSRLRVLIPSSRRVHHLVSYGTVLDFEDAVAAASDTDIVSVPLYSRRVHLRQMLCGRRLETVTPPRSRYDVCLLVAMAPYWVPSLRYIRHLRQRATRVIVYLYDAWLADLPTVQAQRSAWDDVDELFVSFPHVVSAYSAALRRPVHYLPQAIDPGWFRPYRRERPIDVLSVGRRLPHVHTELLQLSRRRDWFYIYQDVYRPHAIDLRESQSLHGRLCQSARAQVSWSVEHTRPDLVAESGAVTLRWFEAAASGSVVVGKAPPTDEFARLFPDVGFVHDLSPTASTADVEVVLDDALRDGRADERRMLAEYVCTAHTWNARWRELVEIAGL